MKKKTSWHQKLNNSKDLPKVEKIDKKKSKRWAAGTYVIPAPIEVDARMKKNRFLSIIFILIPALMICNTAIANPIPAKTVHIKLLCDQNNQTKTLVKILTKQINQRCSAEIVTTDKANFTIALAIDNAVPEEGFRINCRTDNSVRITGADHRGLLYGIGKFLRTSTYSQNNFTPGTWQGTSSPDKKLRGIYFATHFHNFYHDAPIEQVQRYVEDLGLWGINTITVWYDMHHFNGANDPKAIAFRSRLKQILHCAKKIGLEVGLLVLGNEAYANSPVELRSDPSAQRGGYYANDICPNKPGGMEYILQTMGDYFDYMKDIEPKFIWVWPYDQGSCGCDKCRPWGTNGFIKCVKNISKLAKEKFPKAKIILSTWDMDEDEWKTLIKDFADTPDWIDYILAECFTKTTNDLPLRLGIPGRLPMIGFPEISMHNMCPWGGFGANPQPDRFQSYWNWQKNISQGGFPYSEGIFEDINKIIWAQFYWNQNKSAWQTVQEYATFEFSPQVADDVVKVIKTLEQNHHFRYWKDMFGPNYTGWNPARNAPLKEDKGAHHAYEKMKQLDKKLSPYARKNWRWRILYLRALLDSELKQNNGEPTQLCENAFAELTKIYHAQNANRALKPPIKENKTVTPINIK